MKKILAIALAAALAVSVSVAVFAAPTDITAEGTPIADGVSADYSQYTLEKAFDNDVSADSRWQSAHKGNNGDDSFIGVTFEGFMHITSLKIDWETAHPAIDGFRVEYLDGNNWVNAVFSNNRTTTEDGNHEIDEITLDVETKGIRVYCFSAYVKGEQVKESPSVYEFDVFGEASRSNYAVDNNAQGGTGSGPEERPDTGVESSLVWVVVLAAAAGVVFVTKKVRA